MRIDTFRYLFFILLLGSAPSALAQTDAEKPAGADETKPKGQDEKTPSEDTETSKDAPTGPVVDDLGVDNGSDASESDRSLRHRFAGNYGAVGVLNTIAADLGVENTFRLRGLLGGFSTENFPIDGAENDFLKTGLSLGYTLSSEWAFNLAVNGTSNTNSLGQPELIQTQGDLTIGGQYAYSLKSGYTMGAVLNAHLMSDVGSGGFALDATSFELRGLFTVDYQRLEGEPVRLHANLGYFVENGESLNPQNGVEPSLIQEFGLQNGRYDRLSLNLAAEILIHEEIVPFFEYEVSMPILVELARRSDDSNDYGFYSIPHSVSFGARFLPIERLALEGGLQLGLSDQPYTGVPATAPWMLFFAVAYHLDPEPVVVERTVSVKVPETKTVSHPRIELRVVDSEREEAIPDAQVAWTGHPEFTTQVTDTDGFLKTYRLAPGSYSVTISADGFKSDTREILVDEKSAATRVFKLEKAPLGRRGLLKLAVRNEKQKPLKALVQFGGKAADITGQSDLKGLYERALDAGDYSLRVNARGYREVNRKVTIQSGETAQVELRLQPITFDASPVTPRRRPAARTSGRLARVTRMGIAVKSPIKFEKASSTLTGTSVRVLKAVAQEMRDKPYVRRIRVEVHTDGRGSAAEQLTQSRQRAEAVKTVLVKNGVSAKRVSVRGYGGSKLLLPPVTKRGRDRNERVEFIILKADR